VEPLDWVSSMVAPVVEPDAPDVALELSSSSSLQAEATRARATTPANQNAHLRCFMHFPLVVDGRTAQARAPLRNATCAFSASIRTCRRGAGRTRTVYAHSASV